MTQRYARLITLHYTTTTTAAATTTPTTTTLQLTLHYTTLITLHYTTTTTTLPYTTLHWTTLYHTTLHNTTRHCTALHYTNYTTSGLQLQLHLQLHWLHYITTTTPLHYTTTTATTATATTTALHHTTSSNFGKVATATIATIPKNTTPTTCRSISGFALPWPTSPIGFLFLKLPPPPCAVLLVWLIT